MNNICPICGNKIKEKTVWSHINKETDKDHKSFIESFYKIFNDKIDYILEKELRIDILSKLKYDYSYITDYKLNCMIRKRIKELRINYNKIKNERG